ncbi:HlyD family type I secretion periplasmic adaptor subunit [Jannaschia ovalis]|uniref:Membrane fusion protein (MFP) family protein n=1 Tax=Jannaschia ovalis TaxID=3038773 RepID=A0ABY8LEC4_9RHOB|nr:HlyD family type I secretion periplasmic adaptor subunit [Jannaschia sp. GRR-S6-38]WGH79662.1 HlyD family type I secretion periplasmic adaptor subunit [Jannaschia sp. GRR-S6-38]
MTGPDTRGWDARRPVRLGLATLAVLLGGAGSWAVMADISGAIIAGGHVAVERNLQVVQHPDGGVVTEILARDGDAVAAGAVLLRLDPELMRGEARILEGRLRELAARTARLVAERDGADALAIPAPLRAAARGDERVAEVIAGQAALFAARHEARQRETAQLARRKDQLASQAQGVAVQAAALDDQLRLIRAELANQTRLLDRGLTQAARVLALRREASALEGRAGELDAARAELAGRATEIDLQILTLATRSREAAIAELRDLRLRELEAAERLRALHQRLARTEVTAPVAGIVHRMQVFADRAVIRPAEPILHIVPQDRPLVIVARVDPLHVEQVFPGQPVTLRFPGLDPRRDPELAGRLWRLSPDALTDPATGARFYEAELRPDPREVERLGTDRTLLPGMPVEAYLRTGDRSALSYLAGPLTAYFGRAFREE